MDAYTPFLAKIVRLDVHHQRTFAIAGVVGNRVEAIKKRREKQLEAAKKEQSRDKPQQQQEDEQEEKHLDIWA
ncbi:hypothetical protein ACFOEE_08300 [Pseudoalteromonas fenneropenaei]|uniref:Uncharacterized protein n=1 Tax=Pseudoalteromonas fenneropenaei TaxID=1737459 RepID=A0ABV7CJ09_9GAMM